MEKENSSRVRVVVILVVILALIGGVAAYIAHQNSVERERIAKEKAKAAQKAEEEKSKKICESLSFKNFTCMREQYGNSYCDFVDEEKMDSYTISDDGHTDAPYESYYKVSKLKDKYVIYTALSEITSEDEEYDYVVTKIDGEQITEFMPTEDYGSEVGDVYTLGGGEKESEFSGLDVNAARTLAGNRYEDNKDKNGDTYSFGIALRSETMLAWGECSNTLYDDGERYDLDYLYGVKKIGDDKYAIDIVDPYPVDKSESSILFEDGYDYIVTKMDGSQIVEFKDSKGKNPHVYKLTE